MAVQASAASVFNPGESGASSETTKDARAPAVTSTGAKPAQEGDDQQATKIWVWGDSLTSPGLPGMSHCVRLEPGGENVR